MRFRAVILMFLVAAFVEAARAQGGGSPADVAAIRAIETQWQNAWNHHDVAAMVGLGAPDADWVNLAGQWFAGAKPFAKSLESLHSRKVKESVWRTEEVRARFLSPTIAVVHVYFSTSGERNPDGSPRPPRRGIFTRVEEKRGGRWLIIASQATSITSPETALRHERSHGAKAALGE
jgi:uncharacterized protein (TIGR02246 family)